ncbi:MAG TPA: hypothetical protein VGF55_12560, partial [Gemmataceae bacterium]
MPTPAAVLPVLLVPLSEPATRAALIDPQLGAAGRQLRGDAGAWPVRMSLDDFAAVGNHEYQRVQLKIPGEGKLS